MSAAALVDADLGGEGRGERPRGAGGGDRAVGAVGDQLRRHGLHRGLEQPGEDSHRLGRAGEPPDRPADRHVAVVRRLALAQVGADVGHDVRAGLLAVWAVAVCLVEGHERGLLVLRRDRRVERRAGLEVDDHVGVGGGGRGEDEHAGDDDRAQWERGPAGGHDPRSQRPDGADDVGVLGRGERDRRAAANSAAVPSTPPNWRNAAWTALALASFSGGDVAAAPPPRASGSARPSPAPLSAIAGSQVPRKSGSSPAPRTTAMPST